MLLYQQEGHAMQVRREKEQNKRNKPRVDEEGHAAEGRMEKTHREEGGGFDVITHMAGPNCSCLTQTKPKLQLSPAKATTSFHDKFQHVQTAQVLSPW